MLSDLAFRGVQSKRTMLTGAPCPPQRSGSADSELVGVPAGSGASEISLEPTKRQGLLEPLFCPKLLPF